MVENKTDDLEEFDYKFDRDNDGMFKEVLDKQELYSKYYLGIKGAYKNKHIHLVHCKQIELSNDFVLKYYYKFQDNPQYEGKFVIKNKTKVKGEEERYTIISEKEALDYIEMFSQNEYEEWINFKGYDNNLGKKGYVRLLIKKEKF